VEPVPEVAATLSARAAAVLALGLALLLGLAALAAPAAAGRNPASSSDLAGAATSNFTASMSGPTLLATSADGFYDVNATGGAAYAPNGTLVGNITYYASIFASNTTGITFTPTTATISNGSYRGAALTVNAIAQLVTIDVLVTSVSSTANDSINLTYTIHVVQPYELAATLVDRSTATVLSFVVTIELDGSAVGTVTVPTFTAGSTYDLSYKYVTLGLGSGWHTFTISLANEHGLVTFPNGSTAYSVSFYIPGAPPDYTLWYVAGIVAFLGVVFIFATRVAARRRGAVRR